MLAYRTAISSLILEDIPLGSTDITVLCDVSTGQPRHIVPTAWRRRIFDSIHRLAHPSIRATTALMAAKFVWQGLCKQVCSWARACVLCQTYKVQHHVRAPLQDFAIPQHRFDHIHVDLVGPLPPSCSVTHLLTIVDLLRRWPEDVPLADTSATTCERALTAHWFARFGVSADISLGYPIHLCTVVGHGPAAPHHGLPLSVQRHGGTVPPAPEVLLEGMAYGPRLVG